MNNGDDSTGRRCHPPTSRTKHRAGRLSHSLRSLSLSGHSPALRLFPPKRELIYIAVHLPPHPPTPSLLCCLFWSLGSNHFSGNDHHLSWVHTWVGGFGWRVPTRFTRFVNAHFEAIANICPRALIGSTNCGGEAAPAKALKVNINRE